MMKPNLIYFDGKKNHTSKICAHCKFFSSSYGAGECSRCKTCYPNACLCTGTFIDPTSCCKYWIERVDADKIKTKEDLPDKTDLEWDENYICKY